MHKKYLNIHKETEKYNRHGWLHHKKIIIFSLRGQGPVVMYKFNAATSYLVQKIIKNQIHKWGQECPYFEIPILKQSIKILST